MPKEKEKIEKKRKHQRKPRRITIEPILLDFIILYFFYLIE
jgi:hypothetical protein